MERVVCDQCQKSVRSDTPRFGWYHLEESWQGASSETEWDFCSPQCTQNWLKKKLPQEPVDD